MHHSAFNIDSTEISPDDPRYEQRLNSQHRLALQPGLVIAGLIGGAFAALPFAASKVGFPLEMIPAGVVSVVVLLGIGLVVMALAQGAWRLIPAFWTLRASLDEQAPHQKFIWYLLEIGGFILWFGVGFALAFLLL